MFYAIVIGHFVYGELTWLRLVASLRQAQQNALASVSSTAWGVRFDNGAASGVTSGMVSRWRLDEGTTGTAANSAGGPAGTGSGTLGVAGSCRFNGCWTFNGSNTYVAAAAIPGLTPVHSVTFWIMKTSDGYVFDMGGNNNWIQLFGGGRIRAGSNPGGGYWDSNATLANDAWHFVAVTRDASNVQRIYINGALDRTDTMTATLTPGAIRIGSYGGSGYHVTGQIDDVRVYNRAITGGEVATLFSETGSGSAPGSYAVFASSTWSAGSEVSRTTFSSRVTYATSSLASGSSLDVVFAAGTGRTTSSSVKLRSANGSKAFLIQVAPAGLVTVTTSTPN